MSATQADDMAAAGLPGRLDWARVVPPPAALRFAAAFLVVVAIALVLARISQAAFLLAGGLLLVAAAYASDRWPRATLTVAFLTPLVDRYTVAALLPDDVSRWMRFASEIIVVVIGVVISVNAIRSRRFIGAFRHPVTILLAAFLLVSLTSMIVNGVPTAPAVVGTIFTVDAIALFFLARMVGFNREQLARSAIAFIGLVTVAALLGISQPLLDPDMFGFNVVQGRYGEGVRAVSFLIDPGLLGTVTAMAIGFPLLSVHRFGSARLQIGAIALAFVLMLALVLTFSRGSWLGFVVGFTAVALLLNWRAFVVAVVIAVLAVGTAVVMPRNLLVAAEDNQVVAERPDLGGTGDRVERVAGLQDLRSLFIQNGLPIFADHPIVGVGPGMFGGAAARTFDSPIYEEYGTNNHFWNPRQQTVDNFWLHILVEGGILGTLAFAGMLAIAGIEILRSAWRSSGLHFVLMAGILSMLSVLTISGVTGMLLEGNVGAFPLWFFLGAGSVVAAATRRSRPVDAEPAVGREAREA